MMRTLYTSLLLLASLQLYAAPMPAPSVIGATDDLDMAASWYDSKVANVGEADDCFPVLVSRSNGVNLFYLYCSEKAAAAQAKETKVTENFTVSAELAPRFNFWRRVYSLWSHEQYVLHAADYPEIVFEIADSSALPSNTSEANRQRLASKTIDGRRNQYRVLLNRMHQLRSNPDAFTPAMKRVAALMAHISEENKYEKVGNNLRVQRGQRTMIATGLNTASRYLHAVEKAFVEEGIPPELSKIAFIESSFNLKAMSKVGASGVYQIMPATGREFKMIVTDIIDERNDPIKAAHAAARLLRSNFARTNAWPLAVTAYNHGVNGIGRAVRAVGSNRIEDLIARYEGPAFGFASKNFFTGFMGLIATVAQADTIFPDVPRLEPLNYTEVKLDRAKSIRAVSKQFKMTFDVILDYNPDITRRHIYANGMLPRGYVLKVPALPVAMN